MYIPHQELLPKLWKVGIIGSIWKWFREYLTGRHQHVRINSYTSSTLPVISSVPQGSLLGPLLFLIYINNLPPSVKYTKIFLFTDDTKCLQPISSPRDCILLQSDLDALSLLSTTWKLMFNETKCSLLSIRPANENHHRYSINNQPIISSSLQKDLGILVSSDLFLVPTYIQSYI